MSPSIFRLFRSYILLLLTAAFITACNSSDTGDTNAGVDTGAVTLLITDAPTSYYDEVNVVAESVTLIGEGPHAHLMKRPARINLLDLRNTFRRLSKSKAPVGTYSKVRFRIRDVELVKRDQYGVITERVIPRLESNFVDLNARTQFAVDRLRNLIVKLDLDADKSLGTDPTTGDPVFDPDATVDVDSVPTDTPDSTTPAAPVLMNEQGVVRNRLADSFQLCDPDLLSDCVQVNAGAETVVMNSNLDAVGIGDIAENTEVQVLGHLDVNTDAISALHVLQVSSRLNTYTGTLSGAVLSDSINFTVTAGTQAGNTYAVTPASLPGIYDSTGNTLDINALGDGVNAEVIGILTTFPPPGNIKPGVIIITTP